MHRMQPMPQRAEPAPRWRAAVRALVVLAAVAYGFVVVPSYAHVEAFVLHAGTALAAAGLGLRRSGARAIRAHQRPA